MKIVDTFSELSNLLYAIAKSGPERESSKDEITKWTRYRTIINIIISIFFKVYFSNSNIVI